MDGAAGLHHFPPLGQRSPQRTSTNERNDAIAETNEYYDEDKKKFFTLPKV